MSPSGYVAFIFHTWFFIYLKDGRGLDLKSSALFGTLPFIAMTTCCLLGGVISDWLVKHTRPVCGRSLFGAFTLFLAAIFLVIGSHAQDSTVAVLVLAGGAGALYLGQATYWAVAADFGGPFTGVVSGLIEYGRSDCGRHHGLADAVVRVCIMAGKPLSMSRRVSALSACSPGSS